MFRHTVLKPAALAVAGTSAAVLLLAACSSSGGSGGSSSPGSDTGPAAGGAGSSSASSSSSKTIDLVASTNVYGDIASKIGGSSVNVQSIISDPDQDPHSYEADSRTQLALSRADIVIENGGGYDDFVDRMLKSAGKSPTTLNVVDISGKKAPTGGELNEHVWYDFPTVQKLVDDLVTDLSKENPADAATYKSNAAAFSQQLKTMEATEASIKSADSGDGAAITEPVPLYMLDACGLVNKTPSEFSEGIEEGEGVPTRVLNETLDLFSDKKVKLLAYNEQTSGPETEKVLKAAKQNNVAVVPVTETLPTGKDYVTWMTGNLNAIKSALG